MSTVATCPAHNPDSGSVNTNGRSDPPDGTIGRMFVQSPVVMATSGASTPAFQPSFGGDLSPVAGKVLIDQRCGI